VRPAARAAAAQHEAHARPAGPRGLRPGIKWRYCRDDGCDEKPAPSRKRIRRLLPPPWGRVGEGDDRMLTTESQTFSENGVKRVPRS
jgi:hypothetical protein